MKLFSEMGFLLPQDPTELLPLHQVMVRRGPNKHRQQKNIYMV